MVIEWQSAVIAHILHLPEGYIDAQTVFHQCSISYTGYRYASTSTSRLLRSCTSRCLAFRHRTWPTTAVLLPVHTSGDCIPQQAEHASWCGHTAPLATERSQLPVPDYGTVFHCTWKMLTYRTVNSGGC